MVPLKAIEGDSLLPMAMHPMAIYRQSVGDQLVIHR
jgi:hypothetical protein